MVLTPAEIVRDKQLKQYKTFNQMMWWAAAHVIQTLTDRKSVSLVLFPQPKCHVSYVCIHLFLVATGLLTYAVG